MRYGSVNVRECVCGRVACLFKCLFAVRVFSMQPGFGAWLCECMFECLCVVVV